MTQLFRTKVRITPTDTDASGVLRLSMIPRFAQQIAGQHCDILGVNQDFLDQKGLFWAIIRNQLTIHRLPTAGQTITLETWPMPTTRTAYPRATAAYDEAGKCLFACHSLWILMDFQTRAMVLPGKSGVEVAGIERPDAPAAPRSLSPTEQTHCSRRQVTAADLDRNNHMNNARYLDWVDAILPPNCPTPKGATLCYLNEARVGQMLDVCWNDRDPSQIFVDIRRPNADGSHDRIFSAKLEFHSVVL